MAALTVLTGATATWSVATAPRGLRRDAVVVPSVPPRSTSVLTTTTTSSPTPTTPPSRILSVSSTDLAVGADVTVTGTGCPVGDWGTPALQSDDVPFVFTPRNGGLYSLEDEFVTAPGTDPGATVGADGQWTLTAIVPMVPPGPATLTGSCAPEEGDSATEFTYPPGLRVTVSTSFGIDIEQGTTVKAGTVLDFNLVGGGCPGPSYPDIYLYTGAQLQVTQASPSTGGPWQYSLTVPPGLTPGAYRLEADCLYSRGAVYGSYAPATVTVQ